MLEFLKSILGENITITSYEYPRNTPAYIRDNYNLQLLSWDEHRCALLSPNCHSWRLPSLKKQFANFCSLCTVPCALHLEGLTAQQRRNLIESRLPFIAESQQVYLPFWGCFLYEKCAPVSQVEETMAPGTQLVFLYLYYYTGENRNMNQTDLSKKLLLSKATCSRAIRDLTESGIIEIKSEGTNKWIIPQFDKTEFLRKAYSRMKSPIKRVIYVKDEPSGPQFLQGGVKALSSISMVGAKEYDRGIAVSTTTASTIPTEYIISKREFEDFGGSAIEVWSYAPELLSDNGRVDDISLLLSLDNDPDERIQMGLDEIREKHGLPIKEDE